MVGVSRLRGAMAEGGEGGWPHWWGHRCRGMVVGMPNKAIVSQAGVVVGRLWLSLAVLLAVCFVLAGGGVAAVEVERWWRHTPRSQADAVADVIMEFNGVRKRVPADRVAYFQQKKGGKIVDDDKADWRSRAVEVGTTDEERAAMKLLTRDEAVKLLTPEEEIELLTLEQERRDRGRRPAPDPGAALLGMALMLFGPLGVFGVYRWGRWLFAPR
jgi:hypothetical protein